MLCSSFITGRMKSTQTERYNYFDQVKEIFDSCGFWMSDFSNHSKVFLFKTEKNYYILETSANLNENPQIEQYILTNSKETSRLLEIPVKSTEIHRKWLKIT